MTTLFKFATTLHHSSIPGISFSFSVFHSIDYLVRSFTSPLSILLAPSPLKYNLHKDRGFIILFSDVFEFWAHENNAWHLVGV